MVSNRQVGSIQTKISKSDTSLAQHVFWPDRLHKTWLINLRYHIPKTIKTYQRISSSLWRNFSISTLLKGFDSKGFDQNISCVSYSLRLGYSQPTFLWKDHFFLSWKLSKIFCSPRYFHSRSFAVRTKQNLFWINVHDFRLTDFILKWKLHNLEIYFANEAMRDVFDANFVREFSLIEADDHQLSVFAGVYNASVNLL